MKTSMILLALLVAAPATAGPRSDARMAAADTRIDRQTARLDRGIEAGRVNDYEAARITHKLGRIERADTRLAADGHYSRADYARITARQRSASRTIARANANRR